jgi:hypothetical protein
VNEEGPRDVIGDESGLQGAAKEANRRGVPVPYRGEGLGGLFKSGTQLSARANPELLQEKLLDITGQFPFEEFGIGRAPIQGVNVRRDLPALASYFDINVMDDPKATESLRKEVQKYLQPGKYSITEPEWRSAAKAIRPYLGNLGLVMNVGVSKGPRLHRVNMRDAIVTALWLEGLATSPQAAEFSDVRNRNAQLRTLGKLSVAGQKRLGGVAFGATSRELAEAYPIVSEILAPSIGLRASPGKLLEPNIMGSGVFRPMQEVIRKDVRARLQSETGMSAQQVSFLRKNPEETFRRVVEGLKNNMAPRDFGILVSELQAQGITKMPVEQRLQATLSSLPAMIRNPDFEFSRNYEGLGESIMETLAPSAPGKAPKTPSPTRFSREHVTFREGETMLPQSKEGMKILRQEAKRMGGRVNPSIAKGLGPAPFILALAAVISSGLVALGGSQEEAA